MSSILVGIALIFLAIHYGLARPPEQRNMMLAGGVGVVISVLMIVLGLGIIGWGILGYF